MKASLAAPCGHGFIAQLHVERMLSTSQIHLPCSCVQKDNEAIRVAKRVLRKDAQFLDMRCALTAFHWAAKQPSKAEGEWGALQDAQGRQQCHVRENLLGPLSTYVGTHYIAGIHTRK